MFVCVCVRSHIITTQHTCSTLHIHFPRGIWTFPQTSVAIPLPPPAFFLSVPVDKSIHVNPIRHQFTLREPPTCEHMSQHSNTVVTACITMQTLWIYGGRGGVIHSFMEQLSQHQSGAPVFGQVQPQRGRGVLGQNESQVSIRGGVGWLWWQQLGLWLSLTMLTQTFCHSHIKCCPLLRGENEGWVSYRVPWGALWSMTWRDLGVWLLILYILLLYVSIGLPIGPLF